MNEGSPDRSPRSTTVFTSSPTSPSSSTWPRPATGVPTATSCCPDQRPSTICSTASSTVNRVTPCRRASSPSALSSSFGRSISTAPPRPDQPAGRGRSVGSSSTGTPARARSQYASCRSSTSPAIRSRCQTAKSPYWTGTGGSSAGRPATRAAYDSASSPMITSLDQPSVAAWWKAMTATWSSGSSSHTPARSSGGPARSKRRVA